MQEADRIEFFPLSRAGMSTRRLRWTPMATKTASNFPLFVSEQILDLVVESYGDPSV
jgi:hypothetical protein